MAQEFVAEMPERVRHIMDCWERGQLDELRRLAHQLKGFGGGCGFSSLEQAAGELEEALRRSVAETVVSEAEQIRRQVDQLVQICRRVVKEKGG